MTRNVWAKLRRILLVSLFVIAMPAILAAPAQAQGDCVEAPAPERPGTGLAGAIDPPQGNGEAGTPYNDHSYAGMVWHVYDDSCGPLSTNVTDPGVTMDTWVGSQLFKASKVLVAATNSLHYTLLNGGVLGGLNDEISEIAESVFDNIYMQLFSLFMLILAVMLFRHVWKGDLATVSRRTLYALLGMWLAASTFVLVSNYDRIDNLIATVTGGLQAGFVNQEEDRIVRHILPTELHNKVVYENWLRGEFDDPHGEEAEKYGRRLLEAQAWNWSDLVSGNDASDEAEQAKKDEYKRIAGELKASSGYFRGTEGSRVGTGFLAFFQAIVFSLFQFLAKLGVLLAELLLRILTLTAPLIGLVALIHHDILRKVGRAVGAVILNVLVLAALAGIHFRFLQLIFSEGVGLSMLAQVLLAGIVTAVFIMVGRPIGRMREMISLSMGRDAQPVYRGRRILSRRRGRTSTQSSPQEEFWENVRETDNGPGTSSGTRSQPLRPEATSPIRVIAHRIDHQREPAAGAPPQVPSRVVPGLPAATSPRSETARPTRPMAEPRLAPVEEVDGEPVHIVYRPSSGFEPYQP